MAKFRKHTGACLTFVVPAHAANDVLPYFQQRMPYGIAVPDLDEAIASFDHGTARKPF